MVVAPLLRGSGVVMLLAAALAACSGDLSRSEHAEAPATIYDLDGEPADPFATDARVIVFVFLREDCPIANRHVPELKRLRQKYAGGDAELVLVYTDPSSSPQEIREHLSAFGLDIAALRDPRHTLVRRTGATVTPEAVVYVRDPDAVRMTYRGRIDDRDADFGVRRSAPTRFDLEVAIDLAVRGPPGELVTTPAVGCFLSDLRDDR